MLVNSNSIGGLALLHTTFKTNNANPLYCPVILLLKRIEQKQWRQKLLQTAVGRVLELGVVGAGANFPFNPEQQSFRLHRDIPTSKLVVLPDTGHMIPHVNPEAVFAAIDKKLLDSACPGTE